MVSKPANWEILGYPEIPQPWGEWQKLTKSLGTSWKRWGNLKARRILLASHFELAQCLVASCMQSVILLNMTSVTTTGLECSGKWGNCRGIYSAWGLVGLSGVARICCEEGQRWKCHGHSRQTSGPGAAAAWWLIVLWPMQHWSKELWVVDICISWSRRLHNTWIVGCQVYSKVN